MRTISNIQTEHPLRVIVAGGGIGGLSAAIALRRQGHRAVITLFANAMAALGHVGVADVVAAAGAPVARSACDD